MIEYDDIDDARHIRNMFEELSQLLINYRKNHFKLGRTLHRIRTQRLYERTRRSRGNQRGYPTWEEFCNSFMGFSRSKADMLCSNYEKLFAMGLDEKADTFIRCMRLGWNKLNEVLRISGNEDNLIRWLDTAEGLSTEMLRLKISQAQRTAYTEAATDEPEPDLPDGVQAPTRRGRNSRRQAAPPPEPSGDPDAPLAPSNPTGYVAYQIRFPDNESQETFVTALRLIRTRYDADIGAGTAVSMMALHYLATVPRETEGGAPVEMEDMLRLLEASYGLRFVPAPAQVEPTALKTKRRRAAAKKTKKKTKKRTSR